MLPFSRGIASSGRRFAWPWRKLSENPRLLSTADYKNDSRHSGEANVRVPVPTDFVDLSTVHQPLGAFSVFKSENYFKNPAFRLTEHQVEQYHRDGFVSNVPVLSPEECDKILEDVATIVNPLRPHPARGLLYELHYNQSGNPSAQLAHVLGHWRISRMLHDIIFHPGIAVPTSQLFGGRAVRFWHDQLFCKPPLHGGNVAWHQDYSYWTRTVPMCHMTVHIALDDQTLENGGLTFVPGSHNWHRNGKPLPITADDFGNMESILKVLTANEKKSFHTVPALLKRGEASFHHPLMVHGSFANKSTFPRRAAVVNYFADGTLSDSNDELLLGVKIPKGSKMAGQFFPLVYDPAWN